jgi:hypothetical protein
MNMQRPEIKAPDLELIEEEKLGRKAAIEAASPKQMVELFAWHRMYPCLQEKQLYGNIARTRHRSDGF